MKTIGNILNILAIALVVTALARPQLIDEATGKVLGSLITKSEVVLEDPSDKAKPLVPASVVSYLHSIRPAIPIGSRQPTTATAINAIDIIDATNTERIAAGLIPLSINTKLDASATIKTDDMIDRQYFEHVSPAGLGVADLGREVGYDFVVMGENLALGNFASSRDVVDAWMQSPGHRANMLNPNYQEIGVYAARGMYQGNEVWFAVQHFGTSRTACPLINTQLKSAIDSINDDLKARQIHIVNQKATLEAPNRPEGEEYRTQVTEFNKLVADYNTLLVISQEKIKLYNIQVAKFNECLAGYQQKQ